MKQIILLPVVRKAFVAQLWAAVVATALTGCASLAGKPEDLVRERAQSRWNALVAGDFIKAHSFSAAGYKAVVPPDRYRDRVGSAVQWVGAEVHSVECPDKVRCNVKIRLDYKPLLMRRKAGTFDMYIDEVWILDGGQWSIFQKL